MSARCRTWRVDADEELTCEMDLFEDMERNYGKACRKLLGMEKQREYLFSLIDELRKRVRKEQKAEQEKQADEVRDSGGGGV